MLSIQACTPLPSLQLSQTSPISLNVQSFRETSEMLGKWSYFTLHCWSILWNTPQKINIESEHDGLENDFPLQMYGCFGSMLIFRFFFASPILKPGGLNPQPNLPLPGRRSVHPQLTSPQRLSRQGSILTFGTGSNVQRWLATASVDGRFFPNNQLECFQTL